MLRDYHYYLALVFQWIINEYLLSVRHSSSNYEILKNGLPSLLCFQGSCNWEIMELLKIIYHLKHSPQASGIIIIIIILHMNTRRFNIKCLAQCHLTKELQTITVSRILDSRTPCYLASSTSWLRKCIRECLAFLILFKNFLLPNISSES